MGEKREVFPYEDSLSDAFFFVCGGKRVLVVVWRRLKLHC
jgi:hypothetical protein